MKTGTSSLMDGKYYKENKVMRIDDINAMDDTHIRENEINKLAEEVYGKDVNQDYEEGYVDGYNKAKENLYTKEQLMDAIRLARQIDYCNADYEIIVSLKLK